MARNARLPATVPRGSRAGFNKLRATMGGAPEGLAGGCDWGRMHRFSPQYPRRIEEWNALCRNFSQPCW